MDAKYSQDLQQAKAKLIELIKKEKALQVEIAKQKGIVAALAQLANLTTPNDLVSGVTDAVCTVLMAAEKSLSPAEIHERVQRLGVPPQQNLPASISTTLRRLVEADRIEFMGDAIFGGGYRWKRFVDKVLASGPAPTQRLGFTRLTGKKGPR